MPSNALPNLIADVRDSISGHMDGLESGHITVDDWQQLVARDVLTSHLAAAMDAYGSNDLPGDLLTQVTDLVGTHVDYLNGFADELDAADLTGDDAPWDKWRARASMYSDALSTSAAMGSTYGWDLPYYPAQDTDCYTHCKCSWQPGGDVDEEELSGSWYWTRDANDSCQTCLDREAETPIVFVQGERQ
jgi:hypothetical protein